jgi:hypothetical protein
MNEPFFQFPSCIGGIRPGMIPGADGLPEESIPLLFSLKMVKANPSY